MADKQKPIRGKLIKLLEELDSGDVRTDLGKEEARKLMEKFEPGSTKGKRIEVESEGGKAKIRANENTREALRRHFPKKEETGFALQGKPYNPDDVPSIGDTDSSVVYKDGFFLDPLTGRAKVDPDRMPVPAGENKPVITNPKTGEVVLDSEGKPIKSLSASSNSIVPYRSPEAPATIDAEFTVDPITGKKSNLNKAAKAVGIGAAALGGYLGLGGGEEEKKEEEVEPAEQVEPEAIAMGEVREEEKSPEFIEAKKLVAQKVKVPEEFESTLKNLLDNPPEVGKEDWTQEDEAKWNAKITSLQDIYKKARESADWGKVAEKVGHALTQFFAARAGLRSGVDMSGLKFDKTDWESHNNRLMEELKTDVGIVERERKGEYDMVQSARSAMDRYREKVAAARDKLGDAKYRADIENIRNQLDTDKFMSDQERRAKEAELRNLQKQQADAARAAAKNEREDAKKNEKAAEMREKSLRRVQSFIGSAKNPAKKDDPFVIRARQEFVQGRLGTNEEFDTMLEQADDAGWRSVTERAKFLELLNDEKYSAPSRETTASASATSGNTNRVRVRAPNGQEAYVDRSKLQDYINKGAVIVGE